MTFGDRGLQRSTMGDRVAVRAIRGPTGDRGRPQAARYGSPRRPRPDGASLPLMRSVKENMQERLKEGFEKLKSDLIESKLTKQDNNDLDLAEHDGRN